MPKKKEKKAVVCRKFLNESTSSDSGIIEVFIEADNISFTLWDCNRKCTLDFGYSSFGDVGKYSISPHTRPKKLEIIKKGIALIEEELNRAIEAFEKRDVCP